jgi:hypothetical protein
MKLAIVFLTTALAFSLAMTGVTPLAPAGLAYAKKCSKEKCQQSCSTRRDCNLKCNLCDKP